MGGQSMTASNVLVLDLETTGLDGINNGDRILEVAVANVDLRRMTVSPVFSTPIYYEKLTPEQERSFIFTNGYMSIEDIYNAPFDEEKAAYTLATILEGEYVTTYNTEFDLDAFIYPWFEEVIPFAQDVWFMRSPCLMKAADQVKEIPRKTHKDGECWPSLVAAYHTLVQGKNGLCPHHAQDDAVMAGKVLLELYGRGLYNPDREEEY